MLFSAYTTWRTSQKVKKILLNCESKITVLLDEKGIEHKTVHGGTNEHHTIIKSVL